jgi:hypothetical protein
MWSAPGEGKTSFVQSLAREFGWPMETVIASIHEPSDFAGLPYLTEDRTRMLPPGWAVELKEKVEKAAEKLNGVGVLFLDEISTAPPAVQAALLRVVFERKVGELPLPPGIRVVAAANPVESAAGGWELSAPLANRFVHLDWTVDAITWSEGIVNGFPVVPVPPIEEDWRESVSQHMSSIAAFVRSRPELLAPLENQASAKNLNAGKAYPTPRTWEYAGILSSVVKSCGMNNEVLAELMMGTLGPGTSTELLSYLDNLDLPDPEKLLKNPGKYVVPDRHDKVFALLSSVASCALRDLDKKKWEASWKIICKTAETGMADVCFAAVRTLLIYWKSKDEHKKKYQLPISDIQVFLPILKEAGVLPGGSK